MSLVEFLSIIILVILLVLIFHIRRRKKHPPGPLGFPLLGMLPFRVIELIMSKWMQYKSDVLRFKEYKVKYGPFWSVEIGSKRIVTLASWKLINEAFLENSELFSGRSHHSAYTVLSHGKGIIFSDGNVWRGHRQLAIKSLKELGMGSNDLETRICDEADDLISLLEKMSIKPLNMINLLSKGVSNVISRLVFNDINDYSDPQFDFYIKNICDTFHSDIANKKISLFPLFFETSIARKMFPDINRFFKAYEYCYKFIKNKCLLKAKMIQNEEPPSCVFEYFYRYRFLENTPQNEDEIIQVIFDIFNAGIDTTSNLLSFCILFLGKYQNVQTDLRNEIKNLIEDGRIINMNLKKMCPKFLSFIDEVQRVCSIVPKVHHRVLNDCIFNGYKLYLKDIIFADLVNVHLDSNLFDKPECFKPYRFANESHTKYTPSKYLIPFSLGKRSCLGESIATMELFLFLEKIIQKFKITLPRETFININKIIEGCSGLVHVPLDHFICLSAI